jgi:hypothetical protein
MRRFFTVYSDGTTWVGHKGELPEQMRHKWYVSMPHKAEILTALNYAQSTADADLIGSVRRVGPTETFPCFDGSGAPTDCPGVVIPQGALTLDTIFNKMALFDAFVWDFSTTKPDPYQL